MNKPMKNMLLTVLLAWSTSAFAAGSGGGGGSGGGNSSPPPVLSLVASSDVYTSAPTVFSMHATSSTSDVPVLTFNSGPAGMVVLAQGSYPNKYGFQPYSYLTVQWTPGRDQIGVQYASFTATTRSGSTTATATFIVHDAPSPITGLIAIATASRHVTASWDPTVGGISPVSHSVTACYLIPAPTPVVISRSNRGPTRVCDLVDTTTANESTFSSMSQPSAVNGTSYPYIDMTVAAVGADGVGSLGGYAVVTPAP